MNLGSVKYHMLNENDETGSGRIEHEIVQSLKVKEVKFQLLLCFINVSTQVSRALEILCSLSSSA